MFLFWQHVSVLRPRLAIITGQLRPFSRNPVGDSTRATVSVSKKKSPRSHQVNAVVIENAKPADVGAKCHPEMVYKFTMIHRCSRHLSTSLSQLRTDHTYLIEPTSGFASRCIDGLVPRGVSHN